MDGRLMADAPKRYDIETDETVPVTQADWDSAMRHIVRLNDELRAAGLRPPIAKVTA
jgi:hypothetical protein